MCLLSNHTLILLTFFGLVVATLVVNHEIVGHAKETTGENAFGRSQRMNHSQALISSRLSSGRRAGVVSVQALEEEQQRIVPAPFEFVAGGARPKSSMGVAFPSGPRPRSIPTPFPKRQGVPHSSTFTFGPATPPSCERTVGQASSGTRRAKSSMRPGWWPMQG